MLIVHDVVIILDTSVELETFLVRRGSVGLATFLEAGLISTRDGHGAISCIDSASQDNVAVGDADAAAIGRNARLFQATELRKCVVVLNLEVLATQGVPIDCIDWIIRGVGAPRAGSLSRKRLNVDCFDGRLYDAIIAISESGRHLGLHLILNWSLRGVAEVNGAVLLALTEVLARLVGPAVHLPSIHRVHLNRHRISIELNRAL